MVERQRAPFAQQDRFTTGGLVVFATPSFVFTVTGEGWHALGSEDVEHPQHRQRVVVKGVGILRTQPASNTPSNVLISLIRSDKASLDIPCSLRSTTSRYMPDDACCHSRPHSPC